MASTYTCGRGCRGEQGVCVVAYTNGKVQIGEEKFAGFTPLREPCRTRPCQRHATLEV